MTKVVDPIIYISRLGIGPPILFFFFLKKKKKEKKRTEKEKRNIMVFEHARYQTDPLAIVSNRCTVQERIVYSHYDSWKKAKEMRYVEVRKMRLIRSRH